jgi:hypothetical protein
LRPAGVVDMAAVACWDLETDGNSASYFFPGVVALSAALLPSRLFALATILDRWAALMFPAFIC